MAEASVGEGEIGVDLTAAMPQGDVMQVKRFTVTDDHLKLLRRANVGWDSGEFGAPSIDCKRPYGNSDVVSDIHEIIGNPKDAPDDDGNWPDGVYERYCTIHRETKVVLQIALTTGMFRAGKYECDVYRTNWRMTE